jgi:lysine 2,3-aminomutase
MDDWLLLMRQSTTSPAQLLKRFPDLDVDGLNWVTKYFPMRINPYYLSLIQSVGDPVFRQAVPDPQEMMDFTGVPDPLHEEEQSPVPGLVHRYPDRCLIWTTNVCPVFCRFCTRKRFVGKTGISRDQIRQAVEYVKATPVIRDVVLSGGDPLCLSDETLEWILKQVREIPHVEIIRIGSRVPCTLPQRITPKLVKMMRKYHPLYVNTHFNHAMELSPLAQQGLELLADGGFPLGNQSVLLKGINDDPKSLLELYRGLVKYRVRPYYLYQADLVEGTEHFRTEVGKGVELMAALQGITSGLCLPKFIVDAPGGGGKIPLAPRYMQKVTENGILLKTYQGKLTFYPESKKIQPPPPEDTYQMTLEFEDVDSTEVF